jgi:predicted RNA-binding protein YlxR (DUF448 family)
MIKEQTKQPIRMCAACRKRFEQPHLLRFTSDEREARIWQKGDGGRSMYICSNECLQKAKKRQMLRLSEAQEVQATDRLEG